MPQGWAKAQSRGYTHLFGGRSVWRQDAGPTGITAVRYIHCAERGARDWLSDRGRPRGNSRVRCPDEARMRTRTTGGKAAQPAVTVDAEVIRKIRQHGRSCNKAEGCGVLIGREEGPSPAIEACIAGGNAPQSGEQGNITPGHLRPTS